MAFAWVPFIGSSPTSTVNLGVKRLQHLMTEENLTAQQRFEQEKAQISFQELQKFFAKGLLIIVSNQLDLVDAALRLHQDDAKTIEQWIEAEQLIRAHDEHAKKWVEDRTEFMAVTVAPWVLVQIINNEE